MAFMNKFIINRFKMARREFLSSKPNELENVKNSTAPKGKSQGGRRKYNALVWNILAKLPDDGIREAVQRCIPRRWERWLDCLNRLLACLKRIDNGPPGIWFNVLEQWYRTIPTSPEVPSWNAVWDYVLSIYDGIKGEFADDYMIRYCLKHVDGNASHAERVRQALVALSKLFNRRRFFLSCRTLALCANMSKTCAAKHLNRLVERKVIRVEKRSGPHLWERMADVYSVGGLFTVSDRFKDADQQAGSKKSSSTNATCTPCVRDEVIRQDDIVELELIESGDGPNWWDDGPVEKVPLPTGRDYSPIVLKNVPVDW